jgi:colanic acid biosynthesis glycosyl transferase WcaI
VRIVILSQWYPPEPDCRISFLAEDLIGRGHDVVVLTGIPNYPSGEVYRGYRIRWRHWEVVKGVRVLRVPLYPSHDSSVVRRATNYGSFALAAAFIGGVLCGPADALWVYHPPLTVGFPAWWIGLTRRVPFVLEVQDMWPETLAATGMLRSPAIAGILGFAAKALYSRAAAITVISPGFRRNLIQKGVPEAKVHVIPNWADDIYRPVARAARVGDAAGMTGRFNVLFGGNLGAAQALDAVLDAAALLRQRPEVQFVIVGDGIEEARLRRRAEGLSNVRVLGRRPSSEMPGLFAAADVLLVHLKRDPLFEITLPSKLTAYLASGRPVICAVGGDAAGVVRSAAAGVTCQSENPALLAEAVETMRASSATARQEMGRSGRRYYEEHLSRNRSVDRYESLLAAVGRRSSGVRPIAGG